MMMMLGFRVESRQLVGLLQMLRGLRGSFLFHHRTIIQWATDSWSTSPMFILDRYLAL
jgi:hypothetical protein